MVNVYKSKSMKIAGYGSLLLILLEIVSPLIPQLDIIYSIYSTIFIAVVAPICFILLLRQTKKLDRKKIRPLKAFVLIILFVALELCLVIPLANISITISPDIPPNGIIDIAQVNFLLVIILLLWQLLGEEVIKISIFFLIYKGFDFKEEKAKSFWISWLISSILFGLLHLSTYGYNYFHCIVVIGLSTMGYALLWKKTSSPLMLYIVHISYDVLLIAIALLIT